MDRLDSREWNGIILEGLDIAKQGKYKVYIPELMHHIPASSKGIWCLNHIHNTRLTKSSNGTYGQYFPLHPDTRVIVKFSRNDPNSGYIDRISSDFESNSNVGHQDCETISDPKDRDEQYVLLKTPKKNNIIYINEDTVDEPNTIYIVFNRDKSPGRRSVLKFSEDGVYISTRDNLKVHVKNNKGEEIQSDFTQWVKGNRSITVDGNASMSSKGPLNIFSSSEINIDGPIVNINCGKASEVSSTHIENLDDEIPGK